MRPMILLVEAHSTALADMAGALIEAGFDVRVVDDGYAATRAVKEDRPAVVVVGRLSDQLGRIEFCAMLRSVAPVPQTRIIIALPRDSERLRIGCFEAGADDYLIEPFDDRSLLLRIRSLMRRLHHAEPQQLLSYAGLSIDVEQFKAFYRGRKLVLRPREFQFLKLLVQHAETILPRQDICILAGWRTDSGAARLVDSQVKLLRRALRSAGVPDMLRTVRASGYVLSIEPPAEPEPGTSPGSPDEHRRLDQRDA